MDRRKAIKTSGFLLGGAAFSAISIAQLASCQSSAATEALSWTPSFLSTDHAQVLSRVADILIPETDTPGALSAGVPEFIDQWIKGNLDESTQQQIKAGFSGFLDQCTSAMGKSFLDCSPEEQLSFLQQAEKAAMDSEEPSILMNMKEQVYETYFTSKVGMEALGYEPIPGEYVACMPLSEVTDFSGMR